MDNKTRNIFDDLAETYDSDFHKPTVRKLVRWMYLKPGMRVLEAGCGNGDFTPFLLKKIGAEGSISLLDISPRMIEKAQENLGPHIEGHKVSFFVSDVAEFDVSPNSFDAIVCFNCFPHFSDQLNAVRNFYRLLDDDGLLIICHDKRRAEVNAIHAKHDMTEATHFPDDEEMTSLLTRVGFRGYSLFSADSYLVQAVK